MLNPIDQDLLRKPSDGPKKPDGTLSAELLSSYIHVTRRPFVTERPQKFYQHREDEAARTELSSLTPDSSRDGKENGLVRDMYTRGRTATWSWDMWTDSRSVWDVLWVDSHLVSDMWVDKPFYSLLYHRRFLSSAMLLYFLRVLRTSGRLQERTVKRWQLLW